MRYAGLAALLALTAAAQAEVLVNTAFGDAANPVNARSADGLTEVTGALPAGWVENSTGAWQPDIAIRYTPLVDEGRRFLRIEKLRGGNLQVAHSLPLFPEVAYLRLTFQARTTGEGTPEFGIRFTGAPYTTVWQASPQLAQGWRDYQYDFRLEQQPQEIRLQLSHGGTGVFDLADLKLERFSREELIAAIKARYPSGGSGNLATITRLPLGLPSGWFLDRDNDDAQVQLSNDPADRGPSGAPALRVQGPGLLRLNSAPFAVPWSFERHTVSLSLRGTGRGRLWVLAQSGYGLAGRDFTATAQWQRVSLNFDPQLNGQVHGLRLDWQGDLAVDALQVERGSVATEYRPARPCEVVLAMPPSSASAARVQFEDEPARVAYAVTGDAAAQLRGRVVNLYGEQVALPAVPLNGAGLRQGVLDYSAGAQPAWGQFRIELQAVDAAGQPLSEVSELVVSRLRRPRYWGQDAPASAFGVHTLPATRHLLAAKAAGANWVRLHDAGMQFVGWSWLEPERGRWVFFDDEINRYRRHHLMILGQLETAPHWVTGWPQPCNGYWDRWYQPRDLDAWETYVRTVTTRYRQQIRHWEVWNEPWGSFWSVYDATAKDQRARSATAAQDFAALQERAYRAAKAVDPGLTIAGFNSYGGHNGKEWTAGVLQAGGLQTCDVFTYHKYTSAALGYPGDDVTKDGLEHAAAPIVAAQGRLGKPAWMSEGTTLRTSTFDGLLRHSLPYANRDDYQLAADSTVRYVVSTLSGGSEKVFLYTMHGLNYYPGDSAPPWRTLVTNDGYPHPSAVAHSALAWLLEGTRYQRVREVAAGVSAYLFTTPDRAVAVLIPRAVHAPYQLPAGVTAVDLYGNPLRGRELGSTVCYLTAATVAGLGDLGR
ncbi:MAG: hypothetical protein IT204_18535 [Fimbriimonadaceae bacterium]|nr:hypothetical protein [Fimbriimonadaceae bacterium]